MTWFQLWTVCWQLAVFITPIVTGFAILWLRSQFVTKTDFTAEKNRVDARNGSDKVERDARYEALSSRSSDHESRLRVVEADVARPPSRHALNNAISVMQGGLNAVDRSVTDLGRQMESQTADLRRQMETLNGYLHTVIEKHIG